MVLNTFTVGAAVTPGVIETALSHYLNRKPLRGKPTAHISYDEGLHLVRQFLEYASNKTVDEVQAFTAQWVPTPRWIKTDDISIQDAHLHRAADILNAQLGPDGIAKVGGKTWWQWRPNNSSLQAQWIEMRADYNARKAQGDEKGQRILLYIHGGAYFFGGVDEHRYQIQRHARKLKAKVLAPRYRLAPQFPFPCGLHDAIASYLYLLQDHHPSQILVGGDSAGGGMTLSMLCVLRDQGIPLPAGAILLSPWSDLTHSFPSVAGEGNLDYIPPNGFHYRPSISWPPPNAFDLEDVSRSKGSKVGGISEKNGKESKKEVHERARGVSITDAPGNPANGTIGTHTTDPHGRHTPVQAMPGPGRNLSITLDGKLIEIIDQIQLYATNQLLAHPLVSPVMQTSLGGLPPLLIQAGGGELLADEQIYLAHKAANPSKYPPSDLYLDEYDPDRKTLNKYPPTDVHLQVWEDLCHVAHTLSFTRPAKYMYRGVAQFGAWAYANAQKTKKTDQYEDDDQSIISSSDNTASDAGVDPSPGAAQEQALKHSHAPINDPADISKVKRTSTMNEIPLGTVGKAGDPIPPFSDHMIRERVTRHGVIYALAPAETLPALNLAPATIGMIKPGPVRKWLAKKAEWDHKFASEKRKVQKQRMKEIAEGYATFHGEIPPPTALAGRRTKDIEALNAGKAKKKGRSWGLAMWSGWGSKHDETTIEKGDAKRGRASSGAGSKARGASAGNKDPKKVAKYDKERANSEPGLLHQDAEAASPRDTAAGMEADERAAALGGPATAAAAVSTGARALPNGSSARNQEFVPATTEANLSTLGPRSHDRETSDLDSSPAPESTLALSQALPSGSKVPGSESTFLAPTSSRPHDGTAAYPFKLRGDLVERSASTMTLDSLKSDGEGSESRPLSGSGPRSNGQRPPLETFVTAQEF